MRCLIAGYNLVGALQGRAQNIAPLQVGGIVAVVAIDAIDAVFFRRSRLFFREAVFFSGGEGCEWRAQRATVGESGDKAENEFSVFIPLAVPR